MDAARIDRFRHRQQPILLVTEQLLMRDDPGRISAPTALAFLGADSTQAAPLPHREFRLTQQPSQLLSRVPLLRSLPLDQQGEQALDSIQLLLEPHTCSYFSFHFPPTER